MSDDELYPTPDDYDNYTMKESPTYTPPKVWQWNQDEENRFSKINRPIAGATHDKDLPVGEHPLQLYSLATPNGVKVTVMLEELLALGISEAEYDAWTAAIPKHIGREWPRQRMTSVEPWRPPEPRATVPEEVIDHIA